MKSHDSKQQDRLAYSLSEVAKLFGKNRSWAYRMAQEKRLTIIEGYGTKMVPATEIERILNPKTIEQPNEQ